MTDVLAPQPMSPYEKRRWDELQKHWAKKAERRQILPSRAKAALGDAGGVVQATATKTGSALAERTQR